MGPRTKLAWTVGALLAGLLLAEFVVRSREAPTPLEPRVEGLVVKLSDDPQLRKENIPGGEQTIVYTDPRTGIERRVVMHVNAQGWRGRPLAAQREDGVLRIAALGDSHTFGHGVGDEETWPAVLEQQLLASGTRVEVLNAGVNGYGADQLFALLEKRVLACEPDLVLYAFFCNDLALPAPGPEAASALMAPTGPRGWLREHSRLVDLFAEASERSARLAAWTALQERIYADDSEPWRRLQVELRRVRERVESGGARFAVVLFPFLMPGPSGLVGSAPHRQMRAFCAGEDLPCLDLEPLFEDQDLDALRVHPLDMHADARAHRMSAEELARWLREQGLLSPPSRR